MNKETRAYKLFGENNHLEKDKLIKKAIRELKIQETTATKYYYNWKKEFTGSNNCIPTKEPKVLVKKEEKERAKFLINEDEIRSKEIKEGCINQSVDETTKPNLKILTAKIQGEYGSYELTPEGVRAGDVLFKNEEDIENYRRKEIRDFYLRLGEIIEVLNMGV